MSSKRPFGCHPRRAAAVVAIAGFGCGAHAAVPDGYQAAGHPTHRVGVAGSGDEPVPASTSGPLDDRDRAAGLSWRFHAGAPLDGPAVVGAGHVFVGSAEGYLHALDAAGAFQWSYTVKGGIVGPPVVDSEGRVYVATTARQIYAILPNGTRWWTFQSPIAIVTPLAPAKGGVFLFGGSDRHLWAVSSRAGVRWRAPLGGRIGAGPVLDSKGQTAVIVTTEGVVAAIRGAWARWDARLDAPPSGAPVVAGDGSVFVVAGGALIALGPKGQRRWTRPEVHFVAAADEGLLSFEGEQLVRLDAQGNVGATVAFDGRPSGTPLAIGERLFVPCEDGVLRVVGAAGVVARIPIAPAPLHPPQRAGNLLIVSAGDGTVVALDLASVGGPR